MSTLSTRPFSTLNRRDVLAGTAAVLGAVAAPYVARAQALKPINIISTQGKATQTLQELIKRKKYLEEMGLNPNMVYVADGSKLLGALLSGESDICMMSGFGQVLTAIEKGAKIKILAGAMVKPEHAFYSAKPNIKSVKDLEGKTIAAASPGALIHAMTVALLRKYGVDEKKVTFVNIGGAPDIFRAVAAGVVDGGISEIDVYNQQARYGVHVLAEGNMWTELPEFTFQAAYASDRMISQKRDDLVRTMAAYAKLYRYLLTPESKDDYIAAQAAVTGKNEPEASGWQWQFFQETKIYATDLVLPEDRINYMQDLNASVGAQKKVLPFNEVADMSLARDAIKLIS
jgi:NitT/TauT family transport system substrate-binding protein